MSTISQIKDICTNINYLLKIKGVSVIEGGFKLSICNPMYLNRGDIIIINEVSYKITKRNEKDIEVSGETPPEIGDSFTIDALNFLHGSFREATKEIIDKANNQLDNYPLFFLLENPLNERWHTNKRFNKEVDLRIFLLNEIPRYKEGNIEIGSEDHYSMVIDPMKMVAKEIVRYINEKRNQYQKLETVSITNFKDFGVYKTNEGQTAQLLPDRMSGIEMSFTLNLVDEEDCNCC